MDIIDNLHPEALLLEPREVFDQALIGSTDAPDDHWHRPKTITVAMYDEVKCVEAIAVWLDCDYEEALDYYCYNTLGSYAGVGTPVFVSTENEEE